MPFANLNPMIRTDRTRLFACSVVAAAALASSTGAHALLPVTDLIGLGEKIVENIRNSAENSERLALVRKALEQGTKLTKLGIQNENNAWANASARTNQQKTDVHNLEVAAMATPFSGACDLIANSAAEDASQTIHRARSAARSDKTTDIILNNTAALSDPGTPTELDSNLAIKELAERIAMAQESNEQLRPGDQAVENLEPQPWFSERFFDPSGIPEPDQVASRDFVDLIAPQGAPSRDSWSTYSSGRSLEQTSLARRVAQQGALNATLHGVIDRFTGDTANGIPSEVSLREKEAEAFYSAPDAFGQRAADGSITSIHEVQRGRSALQTIDLKAALGDFRNALQEEQLLAMWLAEEIALSNN